MEGYKIEKQIGSDVRAQAVAHTLVGMDLAVTASITAETKAETGTIESTSNINATSPLGSGTCPPRTEFSSLLVAS